MLINTNVNAKYSTLSQIRFHCGVGKRGRVNLDYFLKSSLLLEGFKEKSILFIPLITTTTILGRILM